MKQVAEQIEFTLMPTVEPGYKGVMEKQFEAFHSANPHVYTAILRISLGLKDMGFRRCGMKMIFERLRWMYAIQTMGDDNFKLNNNYTAYYSRLVMAQQPELDGFFQLREQVLRYDPPQKLKD